jgi:GMP synthase (glutamine-hydrolysing)
VVAWSDLDSVELSKYKLIVLSGSSGFPVSGHEAELAKEIDVIRFSSVPIVGICYGFELIVVAFGGKLKMLPEKESGIREVGILNQDDVFKGIATLKVYEGHRWVAEIVPEPLVPLAKSAHGVEAVKHTNRPIYGFQFHPEKHLDETVGQQILNNIKTLLL